MNGVKHNHVQISKFLMKAFSHKTQEGRKVFYLDFNDGEIREEKINVLGTRPEYFYPHTEEFLGSEVESKAANVFKLFKDIAKRKKPFSISIEDGENIKNIFAYAFLRSEGVKRETNDRSIFLQFFSEKDQIELIMNHPEHAKNLFSDCFPNILINESSLNFVTPHNCIYSITRTDKSMFWCMPISPKCCALLIPNKYKEKYTNNNYLLGLTIEEEDRLIEFNNCALASENTYSKKFIIGDNVSELNRLAILLKEIKVNA